MIKGVSHGEGKHRRTCRRFVWLCVWVRSESGRPEWAAAQARVPERLIAPILGYCMCGGSARGKVGIKERKRCCNRLTSIACKKGTTVQTVQSQFMKKFIYLWV